MNIMVAVAVGALAGAHTSTWGMYKDAVHEGFTMRKYLRSIAISACIAPLLVWLGVPIASVGDLLVLFGVTYVLERAVSEFWKTFLREEDQSKYFIPMQFAVRGRVVRSRRVRLLVGLVVGLVAVVLLAFVGALEQWTLTSEPGRPDAWLFFTAGLLGGFFSAVGGAWKDAPHEGFETFKFFRSPVFAGLYALLLGRFTDSLVLAALAGLGFTVATLETWKTFFFPSKPRGKFAGKPILFPAMMRRRNWFVPLYVAIWILLLTGMTIA